MCIFSRIGTNKKYLKTKKNGGTIPTVFDERTRVVPIGCGNCIECRKKTARDWQVRLMEDVKDNKNGHMVTLTFNNESITELYKLAEERIYAKKGKEATPYELDNEAATIAVRRFNERWRKKNKKAIRHWLVTELGHNGTENIHLHGILWTDKTIKEIRDKWQYGTVWGGYNDKRTSVGEACVNYSVKYIHKVDEDHKEYKPKVLTSGGIGSGYMKRLGALKNKYKEGGKTKETYTNRNGHEIALPIYYRNKIYTEEEREKLWIEKLNQEIRYVDGKKIDISKTEEIYYKAIVTAREKNKKLGYGGIKDWERKKYEEERRRLLQNKRKPSTQAD